MFVRLLGLAALLLCSCDEPEGPDGADGGDGGEEGDGGGDGDGGDGGTDCAEEGDGMPDEGTWGACLDQGDFADAGSCDEIEVPLSEATPPADADATWALVQAWAPTAVEWSRALHDEDSDPVVLSVEAAAEPLVVTRSGSAPYCPPGPDLRFPVRVELAIGGVGGESDETDAVILVEGAIDTSDGVALNLTCFESECVTLGPTWDALGQDRMEESLNDGQAFVTYGVFLSGSVDQTGIQIAGYGDYVPVDDNYGILVALWAGALR